MAGTLRLGDLLGFIQADDDGGFAHVTIDALANGGVGAAIASVVSELLRVVHTGAVAISPCPCDKRGTRSESSAWVEVPRVVAERDGRWWQSARCPQCTE